MTTETKWRKLLAWLRRNFPTKLPVTVRRVPYLRKREQCLGCCIREEDGFTILIDANKPFYVQAETVCHEWTHARIWEYEQTMDHNDHYWIQYGEIYRLWDAWDYGRAKPTDTED